MPLSTNQLAELRHDLTSLADIKYDHLGDELLDHYAALTEENMLTGQSFYEASTAAFHAMGNGIGIQQIQDDYETATKQQVKARHRAIIKSFFRWPTAVTTLLISTLLACLYFMLLPEYAQILAVCLVASPSLLLLTAYVYYRHRRESQRKVAWTYIVQTINIPNLLLNGFNLTNSLSDGVVFQSITGQCFVLFCALILFLYTMSLTQLLRETFYYKPAFYR